MDVIELAKFIIGYYVDKNTPINNLHLQWTLYYVQREYVRNGKIAFQDEFKAWGTGAVIPCVFFKYSSNMKYNIMKKEKSHIRVLDKIRIKKILSKEPKLVDTLWLNKVLFGPDSAWDRIYRKTKNGVIPIEYIIDDIKREGGLNGNWKIC